MESAFKGMGGSGKRTAPGTESGRQLHGRHGYGRFRVLALGSSATWTSVSDGVEGRTEVVIRFQDGDSDFDVDERGLVPSKAPGTTVRVTGEAQRKQRLTADSVREELTSRLAMYPQHRPRPRVVQADVQLLLERLALHHVARVERSTAPPHINRGVWNGGSARRDGSC
ncbi:MULTISPECIES: hypothetical protein [Streptomyces]|uniref:hypothetical protein n=1 Tax=Streptomyces TaxID=1883 RepID=UPI001986F6AB|nr:hypothetical protein [Streptomyces parvus]GGW04643.1 hypothetical protein GCM10010264_22020 [Streptomyces globisporus]